MGTWGLLVNSTSTTLGTWQGILFPAPGLGPKANNHSATEVPTCPSQAGVCSAPLPFSMVPGPRWGPQSPSNPCLSAQETNSPSLGYFGNPSGLSNTLCCLTPGRSTCAKLFHATHLLIRLWAPTALQACWTRGPPERLPSCLRESREVWGGGASGRYLGLAKGNDQGEALSLLPLLTCSLFHFPLKSVVL